MHHRAKSSEALKQLRDGPKTSDEFPLPPPSGNGVRNLVHKLKVSTRSHQTDWPVDRGMTTAIYYLVGDERRAARLFVEMNPELVEMCYEQDRYYTPIHKLNDFMKDLIFQEYEIMEYNGEI